MTSNSGLMAEPLGNVRCLILTGGLRGRSSPESIPETMKNCRCTIIYELFGFEPTIEFLWLLVNAMGAAIVPNAIVGSGVGGIRERLTFSRDNSIDVGSAMSQDLRYILRFPLCA